MIKRLANKLSKYPGIYTFLRKLIEANFKSQRAIIRNELSDSGLILDIPCGIGEFSVFFDKELYTGVDLYDKYINYAKRKYDKKFIVGDALKLDFSNASFNSVLVSGFFHHLSEEDILKALNEIYRVLKKNGKFVLIEDAPAENFVGKWLQKYDVGSGIRNIDFYTKILNEKFLINKKYPIKSGLWNYSVFVLSKSKEKNV